MPRTHHLAQSSLPAAAAIGSAQPTEASPRMAAASLDTVLAWCQPPRFAEDAFSTIHAASLDQNARSFMDDERRLIGDLVACAVQDGTVPSTILQAALDDPHPYLALYSVLRGALLHWCEELNRTVQRYAPAIDDAKTSDRAMFHLELVTGFDSEEAEHNQASVTSQLRISLGYYFAHAFTLDDLPLPLAQVVYEALRLLAGIGEAMLPDDLYRVTDWAAEELLDLHRRLEKVGATDDPNQALQLVWDWQDIDYWGVETEQDMANLLSRMAALNTPSPEWMIPQPLAASHRQCATALLRTQWLWRRTKPALYRHPWNRFVRRTALAIRRFTRGEPDNAYRLLEGWHTENEMPLGYGRLIGFGLPWEEAHWQALDEMLMQGGEEPALRLNLKPMLWPRVRRYLERFATAQGLLFLAQHIDTQLQAGRDACANAVPCEADS